MLNPHELHPDLQPLYKQFVDLCAVHGLRLLPTLGFRTPQEQDALYAQGRTTPGKIVTYATSKNSKHCFTLNGNPASKAFDFLLKDESGNIIHDGASAPYGYAGALGASIGLNWGGAWAKPKTDYDHFEIV